MEIQLGDLVSKAKSSLITNGGWRRLATGLSSPQTGGSSGGGGGGVLGWIIGGLAKFTGWLLGKIWDGIKGLVSWAWSTAVQWVQQTFNFLWYFDWNATDETLDAAIKSQYEALLTQAGGALGGTLGWLVGGLAPGAIIFMLNEPLGVYVLNNVGQEALEEVTPLIGGLIQSALRVWTRHAITSTYKWFRQKIIASYEFKGYTDGDLQQVANAKIQSGEWNQEQANDWLNSTKRIRDAANAGGERRPWSFHSKFEEWRKQNLPQWLQNAAEEFVEEFSDAFWEGLACVANSVDAYVAAQKVTAPSVLGQQTAVRITFNRALSPSPTPSPSPNPTPNP